MFNNFFFLKSCRLKDNVEEYRRARQVTDDNVGRKYRMLDIKATNSHLEYVILIASMLRYTYIACHTFNVCFLKFHVSKILYSVH